MTEQYYSIQYTFIGGDNRQKAAYAYLKNKGYRCELFGFSHREQELSNAVVNSACLVLPLPMSKDGIHVAANEKYLRCELQQLLQNVAKGQRIYAGLFPEQWIKRFSECGAVCRDYYTDEAFLLRNAQLTAQGLLRVLLEHNSRLLRGQKALVSGYGRVGRATAILLKNNGIHVTAAVRSSKAEAIACQDGIPTVRIQDMKGCMFDMDAVINTVPSPLFDGAFIRACRPSCLMLEAASAPYGFDFEAAKRYGKKILLCSGLPGKYTAVSAGELIAQTILREEECL